jgi:hypothetical protein
MNRGSNARGHKLDTDARPLIDLRQRLLDLHKVLLDDERASYERVHGRIPSGEMLRLVIDGEQFRWLHALSELVVQIDEALDSDEEDSPLDVESLIQQTCSLLAASDADGGFAKKYYEALQRVPDAVVAHGRVVALLNERAASVQPRADGA